MRLVLRLESSFKTWKPVQNLRNFKTRKMALWKRPLRGRSKKKSCSEKKQKLIYVKAFFHSRQALRKRVLAKSGLSKRMSEPKSQWYMLPGWPLGRETSIHNPSKLASIYFCRSHSDCLKVHRKSLMIILQKKLRPFEQTFPKSFLIVLVWHPHGTQTAF